MTMVVKPESQFDRAAGQSILEFLFMLPVLIGLVIILVRMNTAIQASIVNQQYARAQALFLAANSPIYPGTNLQQTQLIAKQMNQMVVGISENPAKDANYQPEAQTQIVGRRNNVAGDAPRTEPNLRNKVRIRNSVTLCTPSFYIKPAGAAVAVMAYTDGAYAGNAKLNESNGSLVFKETCGSMIKYEQ